MHRRELRAARRRPRARNDRPPPRATQYRGECGRTVTRRAVAAGTADRSRTGAPAESELSYRSSYDPYRECAPAQPRVARHTMASARSSANLYEPYVAPPSRRCSGMLCALYVPSDRQAQAPEPQRDRTSQLARRWIAPYVRCAHAMIHGSRVEPSLSSLHGQIDAQGLHSSRYSAIGAVRQRAADPDSEPTIRQNRQMVFVGGPGSDVESLSCAIACSNLR